MFLLSAICSLIFLQSKSGKRQTLWKGYTKSFVSCFAILFFIRKLWERAKHLRSLKENHGSANLMIRKCYFQT